MNDALSNSLALFEAARDCYLNKQFTEARRLIKDYRNTIDYHLIERCDRRPCHLVKVSIIIVSYHSGPGLLECLDSLKNHQDQDFEIILVDNGGNESIQLQLSVYPLLYLSPPVNLLPSEGRNLGAAFARGDYLLFIDDDAVVHPDYVKYVKKAWNCFDFLALRGKILPKDGTSNNSFTGHYDLGEYPIPAVLMTEGNMAIRKDVFNSVGGFDPLLFGGEGTELSWRCWKKYPGKDIFYWPNMIIYHNFVRGNSLVQKKQRHALALEYFNYLSPKIGTLTADYGKWYQTRPGGKMVYDKRGLMKKIRVAVQEKWIAFVNQLCRDDHK